MKRCHLQLLHTFGILKKYWTLSRFLHLSRSSQKNNKLRLVKVNEGLVSPKKQNKNNIPNLERSVTIIWFYVTSKLLKVYFFPDPKPLEIKSGNVFTNKQKKENKALILYYNKFIPGTPCGHGKTFDNKR